MGPCGPYAPVNPVSPLGPVGPGGPAGPCGPCTPVDPVSPLDPVGPVAPVGPVGPGGPPGSPLGPVGPVGPCDPCDPVSPLDPVSPVGPCDPCAPVDPVSPLFPLSPVGPVDPVSPVGIGKVASASSTIVLTSVSVIPPPSGHGPTCARNSPAVAIPRMAGAAIARRRDELRTGRIVSLPFPFGLPCPLAQVQALLVMPCAALCVNGRLAGSHHAMCPTKLRNGPANVASQFTDPARIATCCRESPSPAWASVPLRPSASPARCADRCAVREWPARWLAPRDVSCQAWKWPRKRWFTIRGPNPNRNMEFYYDESPSARQRQYPRVLGGAVSRVVSVGCIRRSEKQVAPSELHGGFSRAAAPAGNCVSASLPTRPGSGRCRSGRATDRARRRAAPPSAAISACPRVLPCGYPS